MESDWFLKLRESLESEEGKKSVHDYFDNIAKQEAMEQSQIDRFHMKYDTCEKFTRILERVISKYDSKEYSEREYGKGRFPNEDLYFFFFEYAKKYGREATEEEYETVGNQFTAELHLIHDYFFNIMNGQGTVIVINKI
jgi:hypothetical protein